MTDQPPPPPQSEGIWQTVIRAVSSMTLTQALIVVLLVAVSVPSYLLYRIINDPEMVGRFLSSYEEQVTGTPCVLRIASLKGGGDEYGISTAFAAQGNDRYFISALMDRKPSEVEIQSYCATLTAVVEHMRAPEKTPSATFPNSDKPVIWHYPQEGSP